MRASPERRDLSARLPLSLPATGRQRQQKETRYYKSTSVTTSVQTGGDQIESGNKKSAVPTKRAVWPLQLGRWVPGSGP